MSNHTKGPWHRNIPPATRYPTIFAGRNTHVARVVTDGGLTPEEVEANCDLIAAAPELLKALEAMLEIYGGAYDNECRRKNEQEQGIIAKANRAVEKANGLL